MNSRRYQPEIDGLRGIAVLGVVLFHIEIAGITGGFVGVDVFFVISGYLITRLLVTEIDNRTFSFGSFYIRRLRRLFPALVFTLVICLIFGTLLFSPDHLKRLGASSLSSIFSVSNYYFWSESGYFDTSSNFKPLLHTWSLSIEEQFYFVWPTVLLLLITQFRRFITPIFILILAGFSLYFAELQVLRNSASAFYLAPYRGFEFCFGAILVFNSGFYIKNNLFHEASIGIGLVLVLFPIIAYSRSTQFPGMTAVLPCLGTALCIYSGHARYLGRLLTNKFMVSIGLISYSLYLIHWPVFVFYKYVVFRDIRLLEKLGILIVSIVLSSLMFRYIETPFRRPKRTVTKRSNKLFIIGSATITLIFLIPAILVWVQDGWDSRTAESNEIIARANKKYVDKTECDNFVRSKKFGADVLRHCFDQPDHKKLIIVGDSHASALTNGIGLANHGGAKIGFQLYGNSATLPLIGVRSFSPSSNINKNFDDAIPEAFKNAAIFDLPVLLHGRWGLHWNNVRFVYEKPKEKWVRLPGESKVPTPAQSKENFKSGLVKTLNLADTMGINLIIIGALPNLGNYISNCINRPTFFITLSSPYGCYGLTYQQQVDRIAEVNELLKTESEKYKNISFVDPEQILCDKEKRLCESVNKGRLLYKDDQHLSGDGAFWLLTKLGLI